MPTQIPRIVWLIGINKDQVERWNITDVFKRVQRRAFNELNPIAEPRQLDILPCNTGMDGVASRVINFPSGGSARAIQIVL